jgi:hypothetical protein
VPGGNPELDQHQAKSTGGGRICLSKIKCHSSSGLQSTAGLSCVGSIQEKVPSKSECSGGASSTIFRSTVLRKRSVEHLLTNTSGSPNCRPNCEGTLNIDEVSDRPEAFAC